MKRKNITVVALLFLLTVGLMVWNNLPGTETITVYSENGIWDLRDFDFENNIARVRGPVPYIPDALLTPEEFAAREGEARVGYPEDMAQFATSKMTILLPEEGYYSFAVSSIDFAHRVFVNGHWLLDVGSPGETKDATVPDTSAIWSTLYAENGVVEMVQQGAIFYHREGGGHAGWRIGLPDALNDSARMGLYEALIIGGLFALFIVHITRFAMLHHSRLNLHVALLCLTWLMRYSVTGQKIFSTLLPWLPWAVKLRMEYLALPATAVLLIQILAALFPGILQKWLIYAIYGISAAAAALFLLADTALMSHAVVYLQIIYGAMMLCIAAMFVWKLRKVDIVQGVFLAGTGLLFLSFLRDMFITHPIRDLLLDSENAMFLFAFFVSVAVFIAVMREVEDAKAQEQALAMENAALDRVSQLKTDLMRTISHETLTPLAVIMGFAEITAENARKSGMGDDFIMSLDTIADESKRMAAMMEEMRQLALAKHYHKERLPIDIGKCIAQVAGLYAKIFQQKGIDFITDIEDGLPFVYGNGSELIQVIFNLLRNADSNTENGTVTIAASVDGVESGELRAESEDVGSEGFSKSSALSSQFIRVSVCDTGTGIPQELLPRVFERGVHGDNDGTGFGLAISRDIITAYGGEIWIESDGESGTTAAFTLPLHPADTEGLVK